MFPLRWPTTSAPRIREIADSLSFMEFCGDDRQTPSPPRIRCKKEPVILSFFSTGFHFCSNKIRLQPMLISIALSSLKYQKNNNIAKLSYFSYSRTLKHWIALCKQEGILYAHASIWSVEVNCIRSLTAFADYFLELNDVYWELRSTNVCLNVSRYFSDESELIVGSLHVALERTVFPFVKQYIKDKMGAECCYDLTFRAYFLSSRKRSLW